jgi:hypothetical protein
MSDESTELEAQLFSASVPGMSKEERTLVMEQYKLYVEMMDKVSERRNQANSFFLTMNTALIIALSGIVSLVQKPGTRCGCLVVAGVAGVIFCLTWRRLIDSYSQLNRGKFRIIHLLETRLPARLFSAEWDALNRGDGTVYKPFTHSERLVPVIFAVLYCLLALILIVESAL